MATLRETLDKLKDKLKSAAIVLASVDDGKVSLIAGVTAISPARSRPASWSTWSPSRSAAKGGGRPDMAQAGGTDASALPAALASVAGWAGWGWLPGLGLSRDSMSSWRFCPSAAAPRVGRDGRRRAPAVLRPGCGFVRWDNPLPVVAWSSSASWTATAPSCWPATTWPDKMFALVTGFPRAGRNPEEAVAREVMEEVALEAVSVKLLGAYPFARKNEIIIGYHVQARGEIRLNEGLPNIAWSAPSSCAPGPRPPGWRCATGCSPAAWWCRDRRGQPVRACGYLMLGLELAQVRLD